MQPVPSWLVGPSEDVRLNKLEAVFIYSTRGGRGDLSALIKAEPMTHPIHACLVVNDSSMVAF